MGDLLASVDAQVLSYLKGTTLSDLGAVHATAAAGA